MSRDHAHRAARGPLHAAAIALAALGAGGCDKRHEPTQLHGQVHLTLLHTADMHSRLFPYNLQLGQVDAGLGLGEAQTVTNVGGAARISHIIGRERARAARVLHLDGGDCFQGAPIFNFYSGEAEIRSLAAMGVDAMIVANHEFDRGALNLGIQLQQNASYPVLAANYLFEDPEEPGASPLGSIVQPFTVFDVEGLRVGVVGMGNLSSMTSIYDQPNRLGITPLNTTEVAQFYVDLLRPHVDLVAFVSHLGLEVDQRMIETTTGIDVVLGGHNHIVLQPPKRVRDCSRYYDEDKQSYYVLLNDDTDPGKGEKARRYCKPREVILAHSGAFAKYVGRLDLIASDDKTELGPDYDPVDGFEILTHGYELFPVNEAVPEDPIVASVLEPYEQGLDALANLELLVGYARDGSRRFSTSGGDSPLGNMISTAMWLRLGIQTDFSLTNTTGIRADLVPGPVTVEQMYNIFPFDNSISKMQLSGIEVQDLFDFVARRSAGRGCVSQAQIAGARVVIDCSRKKSADLSPGVATNIYIGTYQPAIECPNGDSDCPGALFGSCDAEANRCWQPIDPFATYELATSNYLAAGGSGFRVLQRNTTQFDTQVQQRDALIDYIRAGSPCGADEGGAIRACSRDADCAAAGEGFVCACPEAVTESATCATKPDATCDGGGACVLAQCRIDVAAYQRATCEHALTRAVRESCERALSPCATGGEQCKFLACVDRGLGNFSDGRLRMVGQ
ncbi:MAG: bifunctional metallophosphatase/5'-nucleotidase [Polyangiaceae bacterium]|nr:bifunctional metallophosphatase/5'-nucleotidase [Polyangiaceae bacterium]